ncbi:uncharacterized protein LOC135926833 [Gordionus sp. m RMFG-2023]|uniref:uncharacterized protein LOC135926833 n=1 Tax=Gordionus sp. m RMFG-2023 TaxID=3053472 RepID=UPI0031FD6839
MAERLVRTFKQSMNKRNERDLETSLAIFLYNYRNTPGTETQSPAEILLKFKPKGLLDQIFERGNKNEKFEYHNQKFQINEKVWSRLYNNKEKKWGEAIIKGILGSQRYEVSITGNTIIRHTDQLRKRTENVLIEEYELEKSTEVEEKTEEIVNKEDVIKNNDEMNSKESEEETSQDRYPKRIRSKPDRLGINDYVNIHHPKAPLFLTNPRDDHVFFSITKENLILLSENNWHLIYNMPTLHKPSVPLSVVVLYRIAPYCIESPL